MSVRLLAALMAVVAGGVWLATLPPAVTPRETGEHGPFTGARGAVHVHTRRSDGSGTLDEVAAAAARAGLDFLVITDHGDGTRGPEPPAYRHDVLVIDAVEIGTDHGHVIALGLPRAPYPIAGEARDVVDDVARLGGMAIAAHPNSPRASLQWDDWQVPIDGIEWLNGDSAWRAAPPLALLRALLSYPIRPAETMARLLRRPDALLARWDAMTGERRVVALAGGDVHARIGTRPTHGPGAGIALPVPGYEAAFRAFSVSLPDVALAGDPHADARAIVAAVRGGRLYSSIDALGAPALLRFTATSGGNLASAGDVLALHGPVTIEVTTNAPPTAGVALLSDGEVVAASTGSALRYVAPPAPAAYRVEVSLPDVPGRPPVPWIVSNPIYVGVDATRPAEPGIAVQPGAPLARGASAWSVESSDASRGAIDAVGDGAGGGLLFRYALGGEAGSGAFVAFATGELGDMAGHDGITFAGWADTPMRLSIQLRDRGATLDRWHRSVYLHDETRQVTVLFDDMRPRGATAHPRPVLADAGTLLFVVDTVNATMGSSGRVRIDDLRYVRRRP